MPRAKLSAVLIDPALHAAVARMATQTTAYAEGRVTIRSIVESALLERYPELRLAAGVVTQATQATRASPDVGTAATPAPAQPLMPVDPSVYLMDRIIMALCSSTDEMEQNAAIDRLDGVAIGSFGQEIPVSRLAYHLRLAMLVRPIRTLQELVLDYENCR